MCPGLDDKLLFGVFPTLSIFNQAFHEVIIVKKNWYKIVIWSDNLILIKIKIRASILTFIHYYFKKENPSYMLFYFKVSSLSLWAS